jgi:hypothetical protein
MIIMGAIRASPAILAHVTMESQKWSYYSFIFSQHRPLSTRQGSALDTSECSLPIPVTSCVLTVKVWCIQQ